MPFYNNVNSIKGHEVIKTLHAMPVVRNFNEYYMSGRFSMSKADVLTFEKVRNFFVNSKRDFGLNDCSDKKERAALFSVAASVELRIYNNLLNNFLERAGLPHKSSLFSEEAFASFSFLESAVLPSEMYNSRIIPEDYGEGFVGWLAKNNAAKDHRKLSALKQLFGFCADPSKRIFSSLWEKDYAKLISGFSAEQLQMELNKIYFLSSKVASGGKEEKYLPKLYAMSIFTFSEDLSTSVFVRNLADTGAIRKHDLSMIKKLYPLCVFMTSICMEWMTRHWDTKNKIGTQEPSVSSVVDLDKYANQFFINSKIKPEETKPYLAAKEIQGFSLREVLIFSGLPE